MIRRVLILILAACFFDASAQAQVTTKITGAKLSNVVVTKDGYNPCAGASIGDSCGGGKYAGELNGYRYVVTPGGCTNSSTPTCAGGSDTVTKQWANNSGTTAYLVNTGATSTTNGPANTTLLATNYTDTDAAKYCENMDYAGYADWFLPARGELNFFYPNKVVLGGFGDWTYWVSTELSTTNAAIQNFTDGFQSGNVKTRTYYIRCARRF